MCDCSSKQPSQASAQLLHSCSIQMEFALKMGVCDSLTSMTPCHPLSSNPWRVGNSCSRHMLGFNKPCWQDPLGAAASWHPLEQPMAFLERRWGWHGTSSRIDELLLAPLWSPFPSSLPDPSWVQLRIWPNVWL